MRCKAPSKRHCLLVVKHLPEVVAKPLQVIFLRVKADCHERPTVHSGVPNRQLGVPGCQAKNVELLAVARACRKIFLCFVDIFFER